MFQVPQSPFGGNMGGRFWKQIASNKFIPSWGRNVLAFTVTEDVLTYWPCEGHASKDLQHIFICFIIALCHACGYKKADILCGYHGNLRTWVIKYLFTRLILSFVF